jgi:hypothetical protein
MTEKKEVVGYYTGDRNIYCVECINNNREIMEKVERAITTDDIDEGRALLCRMQ